MFGFHTKPPIERWIPDTPYNTVYHDYYVGTVVNISSKGELTLKDKREQELRVTLKDAILPWFEQPYGAEAHAKLEEFAMNQVVMIPWRDVTASHITSMVYLSDGTNLDDTLVQHGWAWPVDEARSQANGLFAYAQANYLGVWQCSSTHPWIWYRNRTHPFWRIVTAVRKLFNISTM